MAKRKWLLFLVMILSFVILDAEIKHVTLSQRGVVLGIGIDKEDGEYVVTTEILAPSNLGAESYQKNRLLSVERGTSLEEAFERMEKALGVRISLKHTVLIVLGESMMKSGEYSPIIDLFIGNEVADDTYIIGAHGTAKDFFEAKPPMYRTISYKIAETFRSSDIASGMVSTNVKDFVKMYLSESRGIYIPMVEVGKGNLSESSGNGKDEETDSLVFGKIAVLDDTGVKVILDGDESDGLSYIYSHVNEANLYVERSENEGGFDVNIIETRCDRVYLVSEKKVKLKVTMWVKLGNEKGGAQRDDFGVFSDEKKKLAGETIKKQVISAYNICHEKGVDILGIATAFYKRMGSSYRRELGENYLDKIAVEVEVRLVAK